MNDTNDKRCSCCWYDYVTDDGGHSTEKTHACIFNRGDDHPKADVMAVNNPMPAATDRVNLHRCSCGVMWLERMRLEKRIQ